MNKEELQKIIEDWFESQNGYFEKDAGCIDGYYYLDKLAEYILSKFTTTQAGYIIPPTNGTTYNPDPDIKVKINCDKP